MAGFKSSEFIDRPIEQVFAYASDLTTASEWLPGVKRIEKITDGPLRAGTQFRETRLMGKREATAVIEVVEHTPPRVHAAGAKFPGGDAVYRYTFEREGGGTRVNLEAIVRGRWLGWLLVPLLVSCMKKQDGDQLARLKAAIARKAV
ncbi:MAG: SRPBCC family protein [Phycisphaerae bacterium]